MSDKPEPQAGPAPPPYKADAPAPDPTDYWIGSDRRYVLYALICFAYLSNVRLRNFRRKRAASRLSRRFPLKSTNGCSLSATSRRASTWRCWHRHCRTSRD